MITYQDILESAKAFLPGQSEMDHRNAASRGYYAAYHACLIEGEKLLRMLPEFTDTGGGVHEQLIERLRSSRDNKVRGLGFMLNDCRVQRKNADYKLNKTFSQKEAIALIRQAERFIDKIKTMNQ